MAPSELRFRKILTEIFSEKILLHIVKITQYIQIHKDQSIDIIIKLNHIQESGDGIVSEHIYNNKYIMNPKTYQINELRIK